MAWSNWIECKFDNKGELDVSRLREAPNSSGVYAIATKAGSSYNTLYVGRSGRSVRGRLQSHFSGQERRSNRVVAGILRNKSAQPSDPTQALYFSFLETREHKLIEAAYIDANDRPIGNLIRANLPPGLREGEVFKAEKED